MLQVNDVLGNWKVISEKLISGGGQSEIYIIQNIKTISNKEKVLKLYKKQGAWRANFIDRFNREIKALELLKNKKNIIEIIESHVGNKTLESFYEASVNLEKKAMVSRDSTILSLFFEIIEKGNYLFNLEVDISLLRDSINRIESRLLAV